MKISTKGRYALRLMVDIAQQSPACVSLRESAVRQDVSIKYLEQIVPSLVKAGLLTAVRGQQGGYRLTKEPVSYCVGEILVAAEGSLAPIACLEDDALLCSRQGDCRTFTFWTGLYDVISDYVNSVTLATLI